MIDCDVHCAPATLEALAPYLSEYWREYTTTAGIRLLGMASAYPPNAPTTGGAAPATYDALREQVLEPFAPRHVILNCLTLCEAHRNPHYQAALATALNDWLLAEFLERDDRLRASIVVSTVDTDDAIKEIERLGGDPRFVQVLLPIRADAPYGNRRFHRLYAAAAANGLAVGLHAWGRAGHSPTTTGYTLSYIEDYLANQVIAQTHVLSLVSEGVFDSTPELRVALLECGFAWLPSLLWRFDKDWKGVWREVPWVKERPSGYVRRHFRASTAPAHLPVGNESSTRELLDMVGTDLLMHASDFPHEHGPSAQATYALLGEEAREAVLDSNAAEFYGFEPATV
ncbi:MAG TPA: amidohydrolase family protein [Solirubrobacteraceae bacterium]